MAKNYRAKKTFYYKSKRIEKGNVIALPQAVAKHYLAKKHIEQEQASEVKTSKTSNKK